MQDIILVTIDCWRDDAFPEMPVLQSLTDNWTRSTAVTHAAATYGAFPPIHASQYYPQAYDADGTLTNVKTLISILSNKGYSTGGFVASNPYLNQWNESFDMFWNDGLTNNTDTTSSRSVINSIARSGRRALNLARMRDTVPASDLLDRAADWWCSADGPRFLWVHLMDTHEPYFPTLSGTSNPFTAHYHTIQQRRNSMDELSESTIRGLKQLYDDCVQYIDSQLQALGQFLDDDPIVVMTGDHGEAFNHGTVGHAQLYDEVITVPYLSTLNHPVPQTVRHLDIPATLLDAVGLPIPDNWEGYPINGQHRDSFTMNASPGLGKTFVSLRTEKNKLIREYDLDTGSQTNAEFYDLEKDPAEQEPVSDREGVRNELSEQLDNFLAQESIDWNALNGRSMESIPPAVEDRLDSLGYL